MTDWQWVWAYTCTRAFVYNLVTKIIYVTIEQMFCIPTGCCLAPIKLIIVLHEHTNLGPSVPLKTGTWYIRDILELFLQGYCALQESQMKININLAVAPPLAYPMTSLSGTPTHSLRQYGFFSEPPRRRQMPKSGNLKRSESVIFWWHRELRTF